MPRWHDRRQPTITETAGWETRVALIMMSKELSLRLRRAVRTGAARTWLLWSLVICLPVAAFAQQSNDGSGTNGASSAAPTTGTLEEVEVTAQRVQDISQSAPDATASRLDMSALDTPASTQVISGPDIQLRGDTDVNDAVTRTAGYTTAATLGNGGGGLGARGFVGVGSVMVLYDGIQMPVAANTVTFPFDTWNVDRIETLAGPASVLYGTGAVGGAVNVIPRAPTDEDQGSIRLSGGSYDSYQEALDAGGRLAPGLDYRFDFDHLASDGYVLDGNSSSNDITGALAFSPLENLRFTLSNDYGYQKPTVYSGLPLIDGVAEPQLRDMNYTTYGSDVLLEDDWTELRTEWTPSANVAFHDSVYNQQAHRLWRGQNVDFSYVPSADEFSESGFYQVVQHLDQVGNQTFVTWAQPIGSLTNQLSAGGDVNRIYFDRNYWSVATTETVGVDGQPRGTFPGGTLAPQHYQARADLYDLFAEDRLQITRSLSVVGGLRYDHQYADRRDLIADVTSTASFNPVSWRIGAVYALRPQFNVYAQYSTATDSVGNLISLSTVQQSYALSTGKQLEVGLKQIAWADRLEWSFAAYRIIKNNLLTPDPANVNLSLQVGQQSSRGLEASATANLGGGWHLELNGTILEASYDQFSETLADHVVSLDGYRPVGVPDQAANAWLLWAINPAWELQAGLRYVGYRYANGADTQVLPGYAVYDGGVRWTPGQKTAIDLHVENAFDKFYAANYLTNSDYEWIVGPPREIMATVTRSF